MGVEKTDWVEQFYHKIFPKSYGFFSSDSPRWSRNEIKQNRPVGLLQHIKKNLLTELADFFSSHKRF